MKIKDIENRTLNRVFVSLLKLRRIPSLSCRFGSITSIHVDTSFKTARKRSNNFIYIFSIKVLFTSVILNKVDAL